MPNVGSCIENVTKAVPKKAAESGRSTRQKNEKLNQELLGETICLGKWVSRRGKLLENACEMGVKKRKNQTNHAERPDSRNEAEKPFEREYTGTPRTERTAGMCFYGNNFRERKQNFYLVRRYEGSRRVGSPQSRWDSPFHG